MQLSPHEQERLLVHVAAEVAEKRRSRGLKLNHPETVAILTSWVYEAARDGRTVVDLMDSGCRVLTRDDVMEGIAHGTGRQRSRPQHDHRDRDRLGPASNRDRGDRRLPALDSSAVTALRSGDDARTLNV